MSNYLCNIVNSTDPRSLAVLSLIEQGRRGILVFVPNAAAMSGTIETIDEVLHNSGLSRHNEYSSHADSYDYRIWSLTTGASVQNMLDILNADPSKINILVGPDVLDSGPDFPWVDSGVSSGTVRLPVRSVLGSHMTENCEASYWKIHRQIGRVCRFTNATFILCSETPLEERSMVLDKDVHRQTIAMFVLKALTVGVNLATASLPANEVPHPKKLKATLILLRRLGHVTFSQRDFSDLEITESGRMCVRLRLNHRAGAAYHMASEMGILSRAIPVIAIIERGDIRSQWNAPLGRGLLKLCPTSDIISAALLAETVHNTRSFVAEKNLAPQDFRRTFHRMAQLSQRNINLKRLRDYLGTVWSLNRAWNSEEREILTGSCADPYYFMPVKGTAPLLEDPEMIAKLKVVIAAAYPDEFFRANMNVGFSGPNCTTPFRYDRSSVVNWFVPTTEDSTVACVAHRVAMTVHDRSPIIGGVGVTLYNDYEMGMVKAYIPEERFSYLQ